MKKTAALTTAVVTALLLAGCASGGSGGDATPTPKVQSKAAACKSLEGDMKSVASQLQEQSANLQSDPQKAVSELQKFDSKLKAATDAVSNEQVHSAASEFEQSFSKLVGELETYAKDPASADAAKLQSAVTDAQSSTKSLSKVCG
jgi:outer membrane murein-binding lipoprotein Lpp